MMVGAFVVSQTEAVSVDHAISADNQIFQAAGARTGTAAFVIDAGA